MEGDVNAMKFAALVVLLLARAIHAQPAAPPFEPLQFLIGTWTGEGAGQPGAGQGEFSFKPELDNHVLVRRSYNQLASGPRHEDLMIVYLEGTPRAIYFDSEGHVIHYSVSFPARNAVVFESGDAPGYRLTYALEGKKLNGKFEVGGKTYLTWTTVKK
jgi:hypothetical protein